MRGVVLPRLVLALAGPLLLLATVVSGFAQRPSAAETAYVAFLWLGGEPADLCGGHGTDHLHCMACQPSGPAMVSAATRASRLAAPVAAAAAPEATGTAPVRRILRPDARGPPGPELA